MNLMQNMLSGVLAVILALTGMCGGLAGSGLSQPVSADLSVSVDGDLSAIGVTGQSEAVTGAVTKLLDAVSIRLAASGDTARMSVMLNGNPFTSLSVQKREGGWAAVSNLFPATMLTVKDETLAPAAGNPGNSGISLFGDMDFASVGAVAVLAYTKLTAAFQEKLGEPETGSFTVGGVEFTQKTPLNCTTKEAAEIVLTALKDILSNKIVASVLSASGQDFNPEKVDEALENLKNQDEAELPVLSVALYGGEEGNTAFDLLLEKDARSMSVCSVTSGQVTNVTVSVPDQLNLSVVVDEESKQYDLNAVFTMPQGAVNLNGSLKVQDDVKDLKISITVPSAGETPVSVSVGARISAEAPVFEAAEGLKEIAAEDIMEDEKASSAFNLEVSQALLSLMAKLGQEVPEIMTMMIPSGTGASPVVEDAPVEEAPAEDADEETAEDVEGDAEEAEEAAEEAVAEEAVEEVPSEDAPAEDAPDEDAPVEDDPAEDAPAEDTPVEDAPAA